jgi:hypothetical protein
VVVFKQANDSLLKVGSKRPTLNVERLIKGRI